MIDDDELLQRWLDGELSPDARLAFEQRLARDPELARAAAALRDMEAWLRNTRPAPHADMAAAVTLRLGRERAASGAPLLRLPLGRRMSLRVLQVAAPAAAAAAVLILFFGTRGTPPPAPVASRHAAATAPGDSVRCVFHLDAQEAHEVCLVGSFNLWKVCDLPLHRDSGGEWTLTVDLPRGRHEYNFVVDGRWITDPAARLRVDDGFGRQNAVLFL